MMMGIFNRVKDMPVYVFGHTQILTYQKNKTSTTATAMDVP